MKNNVIKTTLVLIIVVLALLVIKQGMRLGSDGASGAVVYTGDGNAKLDFYVMSQCPYGTQVEDGVAPVLKKFGNAIQFSLNFIATDNNGQFTSLHGENEVKGDIVQLCAQKYNPANFMDMIVCQNKAATNIPGNWESCAAGLDVAKIKACYEGAEGKQLLSASVKASNAVSAQGSPTMFLNNQPYNGGRDEISFTRAVCQNLKDHPACKTIPECSTDADCTAEPTKDGVCAAQKCTYKDAVKLDVTVLNDVKCTDCDSTQIEGVLKQLFKGAVFKQVDVSSTEGKALVKKYGITVAPSYIVSNEVTKTPVWATNERIKSAFSLLSDNVNYKLIDEATGASYIFDEKYREQFYQKLGVNTKDSKPQIDFFVMSYCPYGNQAEEAVYPVYQALGDKATFVPRYVIYENYGTGCLDNGLICSMHGAQELNQNIREKCVFNDNGIKAWFDFALAMNSRCTSQNADTCWQAVAESLKLDTAKISTCEKTKGVELMRAEKELGKLLKVSGSPTLFIEGNSYSGGRDSNTLLQAMCSYYTGTDKPAGCNTKLAGAAASTAAATGGCGQ